MQQPTSAEEFAKWFEERTEVTGTGPEQTTVHMPCPFCAAPHFLCYRILEVRRVMADGATCRDCGRGVRTIFKDSISPCGHHKTTTFEIVQTCGPDAPAFLPPIRRDPEAN